MLLLSISSIASGMTSYRTTAAPTPRQTHHVLGESRRVDVRVELARNASVGEVSDNIYHVPPGLGRRRDIPVRRASLPHGRYLVGAWRR